MPSATAMPAVRRSWPVGRPRQLDEEALLPNEPITVILSSNGWIRAAKGHEIDPAALSFRTGDGLLQAVRGRSQQESILLDSTGRVYAISSHGLPSARGQGEPLTGRLAPPANSRFVALLMGEAGQTWLIASDAGYGFIVRHEDLLSRNRAGKALLTLPAGAQVLPPRRVADLESDRLALVTNDGRLLICALAELPRLARGQGQSTDRDSGTAGAGARGVPVGGRSAGRAGWAGDPCRQAPSDAEPGGSDPLSGRARPAWAEAAARSATGGAHRTAGTRWLNRDCLRRFFKLHGVTVGRGKDSADYPLGQ
jgi:hypothetical protein